MKIKGDVIFLLAFVAILFCLGWFVIIPGINKAEYEAKVHQRFEGVCDYLGGHVATFDEGETLLCIKGGKVVRVDE